MRRKKRKKPPMTSGGRGAKCAYCKRILEDSKSKSSLAATRDHVVPKWTGGNYRVWCCRLCNNLKGGLMPGEWRKYMADNPQWWIKEDRRSAAELRNFCVGSAA